MSNDKTIKGETQVASLHSVHFDKEEDDILVTFRVLDKKYKDYVLRIAKRDDIKFTIRGEKLYIDSKE